jgi:hypothetical protein
LTKVDLIVKNIQVNLTNLQYTAELINDDLGYDQLRTNVSLMVKVHLPPEVPAVDWLPRVDIGSVITIELPDR